MNLLNKILRAQDLIIWPHYDMHVTLCIVNFDEQISDGTIAFSSEHKTKLVRFRLNSLFVRSRNWNEGGTERLRSRLNGILSSYEYFSEKVDKENALLVLSEMVFRSSATERRLSLLCRRSFLLPRFSLGHFCSF